MKRMHGGDPTAFVESRGFAPLDFSANISPLGVPEGVRKAITDAAPESDRYPDPNCRALCAAVAAREGVPEDRVLCGGGAADLIWRSALALKPKRALLTTPCFSEYEAALKAVECEIRFHPLAEPFVLTERILPEIDRRPDLLILCNPNNPTGRTIEPELLRRIVRRCEENAGWSTSAFSPFSTSRSATP